MKRVLKTIISLFMAVMMINPAVYAKDDVKMRSYTKESDNVYSTLVFIYVGDEVWMQTAENVLYYDDFDLSGPEDAKEQIGSQLESTQAQYDAIDGTTYELIYEDDYMMERIAVYYDEVDLKDMQGVDGFDSDGNVDADFVSMDKTDQMLQDEGYERGEEYTVRIFTSHENHVDSTLMFFCDGDRVVMQTTENVIMYDDIDGVSNAQEAEDVIGPQMEDYAAQYDGVDGVVYALTYEEDRVLESIEVNYDEIDMEDVQNIEGFNYEGSKDATYISMKKTLSTLKSQGYKEFTDF